MELEVENLRIFKRIMGTCVYNPHNSDGFIVLYLPSIWESVLHYIGIVFYM